MPQQQDIAADWKSFSPERRDALLAKMTPEQKKKLRTTLEGASAHPPTQDKTPGGLKRLAQGLGVPTSVDEAKKMAEGMRPSIKDRRTGIPAVTYVQNLYGEGKKALKEGYDAGYNIGEGQPVGPNIGKAASGISDFMLEGVLGPVGGGAIHAWGEDIGQKNYSGAAGDAVAVLVNALMLKGATKPSTSARGNKLAYAADMPESVDAGKQIRSVLPDLDRASAGSAPNTVGELLETVNKAKQQLGNESGAAMMPLRGKQIVPIDISNAIKSHITPDMQMTQAGRQQAAALMRAATDYQRPWTFEQLDAARVNANARLGTFFEKGGGAKYADIKNDVGVAVDREVARGVQDAIYPEMDKIAGKPKGYFADLKQRHGALISLGNALDENAKALATRTAKIKGSPRLSTENVSAYGHPASAPGISVHKLQNMIVRPNPLGQANAAVNRSFSGRPTAQAAIYSLPVRELLIQNEDEKKPVQNRKEALELLGQPAH